MCKKIYIVDDDKLGVKLFKRFLASRYPDASYELTHYTTYKFMLNQLEIDDFTSSFPDLILLDKYLVGNTMYSLNDTLKIISDFYPNRNISNLIKIYSNSQEIVCDYELIYKGDVDKLQSVLDKTILERI